MEETETWHSCNPANWMVIIKEWLAVKPRFMFYNEMTACQPTETNVPHKNNKNLS